MILVKLITFKNRVISKLKQESNRFGFTYTDSHDYTNYPNWLRQEPAFSFFREKLLGKNAIYAEYIERKNVHAYLRNHMERKGNYHNELCLALTFEIWLQHVFEDRFRE